LEIGVAQVGNEGGRFLFSRLHQGRPWSHLGRIRREEEEGEGEGEGGGEGRGRREEGGGRREEGEGGGRRKRDRFVYG
jgi:hypothetical protein